MYLTSQEIPLRQALTVPCYWWNWSPERLDDLIQVTKLGSGHMSWASNPDRCPCLWLLRQKGMLMSSKWRIVSKRMKVASGIESLWEQYPMAFAHKIAQNSHCAQWLWSLLQNGTDCKPLISCQIPQRRPLLGLCSGPGWNLAWVYSSPSFQLKANPVEEPGTGPVRS